MAIDNTLTTEAHTFLNETQGYSFTGNEEPTEVIRILEEVIRKLQMHIDSYSILPEEEQARDEYKNNYETAVQQKKNAEELLAQLRSKIRT